MQKQPRRKKVKSRIPPSTVRLAFAVVAGLLAGIFLQREVLSRLLTSSALPPDAVSDFRLMAQAWNTIDDLYVDRSAVKPKAMTYGAIGGMVDALGDTGHSRFLTPKMAKLEQDYSEGRLIGIGAELQARDGHVVVVAPLDNSPAQRAGLKPGDIIMKVDGQDITGLPLGEIVEHITGPAGTRVTLTLMDPRSERKREVTLRRARITLDNVTWQRLPGSTAVHVRIAAFSKGVSDALHRALSEIQDRHLKGIVLDLRNNAGGLLKEAVGTASLFLQRGNVLLEKSASGEVTAVPIDRTAPTTDLPLVALINGGTASAAEIVAGALQDAHRASLVGQTTFGTGTVLGEFRLSDGSVLLLAVQEWLTPDGRTIWHKGISPNISVALPADAGPLFPSAERKMTPEQLRASGDTQLLRALQVLSSSPESRPATKAVSSREPAQNTSTR
jgi:carboxyl-terminal processing protease